MTPNVRTEDERTPLLRGEEGPSKPITSATTTAVSNASSSSPSDNGNREEEVEEDDKPLPVVQILLLCYARLVEPVAFFSIFPFVNEMVQRNGGLAAEDVGFYSGLIESLFSVTQMLVMLLWGRVADRIGRKPVLVFSLLGVSLATALFGLARSLWQMILFRCLAGVFAGTIVTIRTMISEHSTPKTQARSFSWFAFSGNLGIFVGPLIGGALADPAKQYPGAFGGAKFFEDYPYALSTFVVGCIGLTSFATSAFFIKETLRRKTVVATTTSTTTADATLADNSNTNHHHEAAASGTPEAEVGVQLTKALTTWQILRSPGVAAVMYNYGHVMVLAFAYTAVVPVFWFTSVRLGGFGFTPLQISLMMGVTGAAQSVWLLLAFPPLQRRWGTNGVMRACGNWYPLFFVGLPLLGLMLRRTSHGAGLAPGDSEPHAVVVFFWVACPVALALGCGVSMAFTAAQLALNDVSPSPQSLGELNALALTVVSGLRAVCPTAFNSLFAVGVKKQILGGYFVWVVLVVLAAGFAVATRFLPEASEKKKEEGEASGGGGGGGKGKRVDDEDEGEGDDGRPLLSDGVARE